MGLEADVSASTTIEIMVLGAVFMLAGITITVVYGFDRIEKKLDELLAASRPEPKQPTQEKS